MRMGNCYVASEALYHLLGGKAAGWKPMHLRLDAPAPANSHWFLQHKNGTILDPTVQQFKFALPDYSAARGCGFLTTKPSKRAVILMEKILWGERPEYGSDYSAVRGRGFRAADLLLQEAKKS